MSIKAWWQCLPWLSSWALSSTRSSSQDDWETAVPAGDTSRPSHTYTIKSSASPVCAVSRLQPATANSSQSRKIPHHFCPVCPWFPLFFSSSLLLRLANQQSYLVLSSQTPEWPTWTRLFLLSLLVPPFLPVSSPMVVIFMPLSSGSKYRSGSGPISISRGRQQQNGKANTETQSPSWTPSW